MSSESIAKKRGRPKKVVEVSNAVTVDKGSSGSLPTKKTTRSRKSAVILTDDTQTTTTRSNRKKSASPDESFKPSLGKSKERNTEIHENDLNSDTKHSILEKAKAFDNIKASFSSFTQEVGLRQDQLDEKEPPDTTIEPSRSAVADVPQSSIHALQQSASNSADHDSAPNEPQSISTDQKSASLPSRSVNRSPFLSSFLELAEEPPAVSEENKFSDRSAMKAEQPSIETIVGGAGISTYIKRSEVESTRSESHITSNLSEQSAEPAIVVADRESPKVDNSTAQSVLAAKYSSSSFLSLKSTPALSSSHTSRSPPRTISDPEQQPPSTHVQRSSPSITTQTSSQNIQRRQQPTSQPQYPLPRSNLKPHGTHQTRPLRPTEMSYEELEKLPRYQQLKRRYTGLMVGIPVLIVTSWMIYKRYSESQAARILDQDRTRGESNMGIDRANNNSRTNGGV